MNDTAPQSALADAKLSWLSVLGVTVGAGKSGGSAAPGGGGAAAAPSATATDLFFDKDSPDLTASDRASLDAYAKAYLDAKSADTVTIDAYASSEGDAAHNQKLSDGRAKAVADYLIKQGLPKGKVTATGHGATATFSKDDPALNRRATLKPPPAAGGATSAPEQPPASAPTSSPTAPAKTVDLHKAAEDAAKDVVGTSTDVPRDQVEKALAKFLHDLATAQKSKTAVRTTDKVWMAESALRQGIVGVPVVVRGDVRDYDPDDLAHKIAAQLPDPVPGANYLAFLKLKPVDIAEAGSITDQLHKKYEEKRDEIIRKLPKAAQGPAKKAMDAAIEKGIPFVADQALKALGVDSKIEGEMKKAVEDYAKKITGNTDDK